MNKKIFIGLLLISALVFSGGCGSSSHNSVSSSTDVNAAWKGLWTSSGNGTATMNTNEGDDGFAALTAVLGEISSDALAQMTDSDRALYEAYKNQGTAESVDATVTKVMAIFDDCNVSNDSGTAKLTAVIFVSDDIDGLPIFLNGVTLTTTRNNTSSWTATISPDAGSVSIDMTSEGAMTLSGNINYLNYQYNFQTSLNKNDQNASVKPSEVLDGTWVYQRAQGGGYMANNGEIIYAVNPEDFLLIFNGTQENSSKMIIANRMFLKSARAEAGDDDPAMQYSLPASSGTVAQVYGNLYKFTETDNTEYYLLFEDTGKMSMFSVSNDIALFVPMTKAEKLDFSNSSDSANPLTQNWKILDAGGYAYIDPATFLTAEEADDEVTKAFAEAFSNMAFKYKSGSLSFSNITSADNKIQATMNTDLVFSSSVTGMSTEIPDMPVNSEDPLEFEQTGNSLLHSTNEENISLVFISDTEALLTLEHKDSESESAFFFSLSAN